MTDKLFERRNFLKKASFGSLLALNIPGLERTRMPAFLYLWDIEPSLDRINGK